MTVDAIHIYHDGAADVRDLILARQPHRRVVTLSPARGAPEPSAMGLEPSTSWNAVDDASLHARLGDVEILFASVLPRTSWREARRLRLVQMMGVGVDGLLPADDLPAEVAITSLRGVFAAEVAEHVFAVTLALVRGGPGLAARQERREWRPFASGTLEGRTMGILGAGAVGRRVARLAEAFGMRTLAFARGRGTLDEVVRASDVLVVCLPLTPQTRGLVDERVVAQLPRGALVVNVGRGGIVDEAALRSALSRGDVGGAALDVFDEEPLPASSPWWTTPNTIITPHVAGYGLRYEARAVDVLLENVRRLEAGEALLHCVDRDAGY